jgi:hypothetical protein
MQRVKAFGWEANSSMQRTALRAAADAERCHSTLDEASPWMHPTIGLE